MFVATAKWILPVSSSPILNGEIEVDGSRITYCGPRRQTSKSVRDFGDAIIMPGLVNVHTHIEYTILRGFLEDIDFFPWIRSLMAAKSRYGGDDWLISAQLGALECIESGITTIGDNTDAGVTAKVASELGLRARVYQEIFGIDNREDWKPIVDSLDSKLQANARFASGRVEIGVSPHGLYTVRPELMQGIAEYCDSNNLRTSIHIAESVAESNLCQTGSGPFAEMFMARGISWKTPGCSPTQYAYDIGALNSKTLAVHCVQQSPDDIELIARSGASIAYCPKSNAKLGSGIAPFAAWSDNNVLAGRVGIGTDSVVSNNTHDLFEEMRFGLLVQRGSQSEVNLSAMRMVECATIGGATALGWGDKTGSIDIGKQADLIAINLDNSHNSPNSDLYSALVYSCRADDVCLTMVDGRILYDNRQHTNIDSLDVRKRANELRQKTAQ